ncbi:MAG: MBL fold metallo-hydrolase [Asgard group archaeon]
MLENVDSAKITTIVDNDTTRSVLKTSWGISFFVELFSNEPLQKNVVLVDTSGSFKTFAKNASELNIDLSKIEAILITHWHKDHHGALTKVLKLSPQGIPVYTPLENRKEEKAIKKAGGNPIPSENPTNIAKGCITTGRIKNEKTIAEHSLIINVKNKGLMVLVGCSHPGVCKIVHQAQKITDNKPVYGVAGGFHISTREEGIEVSKCLKEANLKLISSCHCTGEKAKKTMKEILGKEYMENGSGTIITI